MTSVTIVIEGYLGRKIDSRINIAKRTGFGYILSKKYMPFMFADQYVIWANQSKDLNACKTALC